jgi:hypothetical protein
MKFAPVFLRCFGTGMPLRIDTELKIVTLRVLFVCFFKCLCVVRTYVYVCMHVASTCVCVYMYVSMYVYMCVYIYTYVYSMYVCIMYVRMCVFILTATDMAKYPMKSTTDVCLPRL